MNPQPILLFLHLAGVAVWIGGMFFAQFCLRPVAARQLEPPPRLALMAGVLSGFFRWVWVAIGLIFGSGAAIMAASPRPVPLHWHAMLALGSAMAAVFFYVYFLPYRRLRRDVEAGNWPGAGAALNRIRQMVGLNLVFGLSTIAVATLGTYWSR